MAIVMSSLYKLLPPMPYNSIQHDAVVYTDYKVHMLTQLIPQSTHGKFKLTCL